MPIHIFWGEDLSASDRAIEDLIKEIVDPSWASINLSRIDGADLSQANQALEEIRSPPFGSGERVVVVKRSPFCNGCSTELAQRFEGVLKLIPDKSNLILSNSSKPDSRLRTTKALKKLIATKEANERNFPLPAIWDEIGQKQLVERTAQELGLEIEPEAQTLLVEAIGNDSARLASELEKLALLGVENAKNKGAVKKNLFIPATTVKALTEGMATNALQIGDSLLANNIGEAIARLDALLDLGEPALKILATLTGQVRGWLWVSLLEREGEKDVGTIARAAGIANPKRIYIMRKQLKNMSPNQFLKLLNNLLDIEASLKKGIPPRDAFRDGLLTGKSFRKTSH